VVEAAKAFADLTTRLDKVRGRDQINVVAHSLGTIMTLQSLRGGAAIDNLILAGSPLDQERAANQVPPLMGKLRGRLYNIYSPGDGVTALVGGAQSWNWLGDSSRLTQGNIRSDLVSYYRDPEAGDQARLREERRLRRDRKDPERRRPGVENHSEAIRKGLLSVRFRATK
jgi:esterase/lipase superfamily enzyme